MRNQNVYKLYETAQLWGINEQVDFSKVLAVKSADAISNPVRFYNALGGIYYCFRDALIKDREYRINRSSTSSYLLVYGKYNLRRDHQRTFLNFASKFDDCDTFYASFLDAKRFDVLSLLKVLILAPVWIVQSLRAHVSFFAACNALPFILLCYQFNKDIKQVIDCKYRFVVFYYDASPDENYLAQLYKNRGITTMTLQHGIFARKTVINNITDTAFELSGSISDYYLAWNQYTKDEAIKVGLDPSRVIVLGAPKYVDFKEPSKPHMANNELFGVILNNSAFDLHNRKLVMMAEEIYKKTGMMYKLRYHPQMNGKEYSSLYGNGFKGLDDNGNTIAGYADTVSFTIISSSSVFVDLLLLKHPTYRLIVTEEDTYSTVSFNSFSTVSEFLSLRLQASKDASAFNYLCTSYDVFNNYRVFFDSILNEKKPI